MLILDKENPLATKVKTRDGREARIICIDRRGDRRGSRETIVALVTDGLGGEYPGLFYENGSYGYYAESDMDLLNI